MDRRTFMRTLGMAGASQLGVVNSLSNMRAYAQASAMPNSYKALVCVFLFGGNDSNNLLVPLDSASVQLYNANRGTVGLPANSFLGLGNGAYGIHPSMPRTQSLFNNGQAAFLANVGTLVAPVTKQQYTTETAQLPQSLMSHPDQVTLAQTALGQSSINQGWGGSIADTFTAGTGGVIPMCMSLSSTTPFINGPVTNGLLPPTNSGSYLCETLGRYCGDRNEGMASLLALQDPNRLVAADQQILLAMQRAGATYAQIMANAPSLKTTFAQGLPSQLGQIASIIQMQQAFGANRQIFFVALSSFDTHGNQLATQASLLQQLDQGLSSFAQALQEIGMYDNVTTFTLSDFSRTLQGNSSGGTDHAWGGHQILMGGAVKGGAVYGKYQNLDPHGPDDIGLGDGRWIPTTSVSQMGATLATWFGLTQAELSTVFPLLSNFSTPTLNFV